MNLAMKRKIPKNPCFSSICSYKLEIEGDSVVMHVNCEGCPNIDLSNDDVCWANLVKGISDTAMPDKIVLLKRRTVLCDRRYVSMLRNAALLLRRLRRRIDEMKNANQDIDGPDMAKLVGIAKALLYDIPQLISGNRDNSCPRIKGIDLSDSTNNDEGSAAMEILSEKQRLDTSFN